MIIEGCRMLNDQGDMEGIIGLIIAVIILFFFIFVVFPMMCQALPTPSGSFAQSDMCRFFR